MENETKILDKDEIKDVIYWRYNKRKLFHAINNQFPSLEKTRQSFRNTNNCQSSRNSYF